MNFIQKVLNLVYLSQYSDYKEVATEVTEHKIKHMFKHL